MVEIDDNIEKTARKDCSLIQIGALHDQTKTESNY